MKRKKKVYTREKGKKYKWMKERKNYENKTSNVQLIERDLRKKD